MFCYIFTLEMLLYILPECLFYFILRGEKERSGRCLYKTPGQTANRTQCLPQERMPLMFCSTHRGLQRPEAAIGGCVGQGGYQDLEYGRIGVSN